MKRILAIFVRGLGILIISSYFAATVWANPVVTFTNQIPPNMLSTPLTDLNPRQLCNSVSTCGVIILTNNTGFVLKDFHILAIPPQTTPIMGQGGEFFEDASGTNQNINFAVGANSPGIGIGETFAIFTFGFSSDTQLIGVPTTGVPEPTTMLLFSTGVAGVAIKTRKRLKNRERTQASQ